MNLRTTTIKYLGWCPGIESASKFVPDRDIHDRYIFGSGLLFVLLVGYIGLNTPQPIWEPRTVIINGLAYSDDTIDESFDYSSLKDSTISLDIPLNRSEFIKGDSLEQDFTITGKKGLEDYLENLDTPNIVIGYAMWLGDGSWSEALERYYDESDVPASVLTIGDTFGKPRPSFVYYYVQREGSGTLLIKKMYQKAPGNNRPVWVLRVEFNQNSEYDVTFFRSGTR